MKRPEFVRAYEQLCQGRAAYDKARHRFDQAAARHNEALHLHREANVQINQLKDRFVEVYFCSLVPSLTPRLLLLFLTILFSTIVRLRWLN